MDKMKYDMAGAAAMIGAMRAIALLKPNVRVLCVVCSCENMPDGLAFKPGDVVTAMSGKTIEIINTDAEGRLVLADGLHYAQTLGATHLINAATLTGAIGIALGLLNAGLFSNDDEHLSTSLTPSHHRRTVLAPALHRRLPRPDQIPDRRHPQHAATRYGGAITAAMFLKEFVGHTPNLPDQNGSTSTSPAPPGSTTPSPGNPRPHRHRRPLHHRLGPLLRINHLLLHK